MRSSLTNPSPSKSNYVNFSGKLFNVILVKEERPSLQKSASWLIEPTIAPAHLHFWQMRRAQRQRAYYERQLPLQQ
jgi:hypothetical protein